MYMEYHLEIYKGEKYYIGFCEEIPGAMTQGKTIKEVKENMKDAIQLMKKQISHSEFSGQTPVRESLVL